MAPPVNFFSRRPFHKQIIHCICHIGKINLSCGIFHVCEVFLSDDPSSVPPRDNNDILDNTLWLFSIRFHDSKFERYIKNPQIFKPQRWFYKPSLETRHKWDHPLSKRDWVHLRNPIQAFQAYQKNQGAYFQGITQTYIFHMTFPASTLFRAVHTLNKCGRNHISCMA